MAAWRTLAGSRMATRGTIDVRGDWSREGGMVVCTVTVEVPKSVWTKYFAVPRVMRASYSLPVQRNKSEWRGEP